MGLFRKKRDEGVIDLSDGQVAVSQERLDEMADQAVQKVFETYDEGATMGIWEIIERAIEKRHGSDLGELLGGILISLARTGYGYRQIEDEMESAQATVPWLTREIEDRMNSDEDETGDIVGILAGIVVDLCDLKRDDPSAPRSIDAIEHGLSPLRDIACRKFVIGAANMAANEGLCEPGELPDGVDAEEMLAIWRVGFLVRACETSLPERWTDPDVSLIVVDSEVAREAAHEWGEEHPDASQEESDEAMERIMLDPKFRIDVDDERVGRDPRFVMFELDADGRIIRQPQDSEADEEPVTLEELERKYGVG